MTLGLIMFGRLHHQTGKPTVIGSNLPLFHLILSLAMIASRFLWQSYEGPRSLSEMMADTWKSYGSFQFVIVKKYQLFFHQF